MAQSKVWTSKDGVVAKEILKTGSCIGSPYDYAQCKIDCKLQTVDVIVKSEYMNKGIIDIVVGEANNEFDIGIERCVCTMRRGEESLAEIKMNTSEHSFQTMIRLINFTNDAPVHEWSDARRQIVALHHKERGVALFQEGCTQGAFFRFSKAVKLLIMIGLMDPSIRSHYTTLCNNMALCQLLHDNTVYALELCNKVLGMRPDNVKGLLRRAEAFTRLGHMESAIADLVRATQLEPANTVASQKLDVAKQKLQQEELKYVHIVKRMFQL